MQTVLVRIGHAEARALRYALPRTNIAFQARCPRPPRCIRRLHVSVEASKQPLRKNWLKGKSKGRSTLERLRSSLDDTPAWSWKDWRGKLAFQYFLWRESTIQDLQLFSGFFFVVVLAFGWFAGLLSDAITAQSGDGASVGSDAADVSADAASNFDAQLVKAWTNLYSVLVLAFGADFPDSDEITIPQQVFSVGVVAIGLAAFALVLALVEQVVLEVVEDNVKKGSQVYETGHVLVLGWCTSKLDVEIVFKILQQLSQAYRNDGGITVVVLTMRQKLEMEALFRRAIPERLRYGSSFVFRQGSPLIPADLVLVAGQNASSVIVVSDHSRSPDEADAQSLRCAILLDELGDGEVDDLISGGVYNAGEQAYEDEDGDSDDESDEIIGVLSSSVGADVVISNALLGTNARRERGSIIIEIKTANALPLLSYACSSRVVAVPTFQHNARRLAKLVKQPIISVVSHDLMDFQAPANMYVQAFPQLAGCRFGELAFRFHDAIVLGVQVGGTTTLLSPPSSYVMDAADYLVLLRPTGRSADTYHPRSKPYRVPDQRAWVAAATAGGRYDYNLPPSPSLSSMDFMRASMDWSTASMDMMHTSLDSARQTRKRDVVQMPQFAPYSVYPVDQPLQSQLPSLGGYQERRLAAEADISLSSEVAEADAVASAAYAVYNGASDSGRNGNGNRGGSSSFDVNSNVYTTGSSNGAGLSSSSSSHNGGSEAFSEMLQSSPAPSDLGSSITSVSSSSTSSPDTIEDGAHANGNAPASAPTPSQSDVSPSSAGNSTSNMSPPALASASHAFFSPTGSSLEDLHTQERIQMSDAPLADEELLISPWQEALSAAINARTEAAIRSADAMIQTTEAMIQSSDAVIQTIAQGVEPLAAAIAASHSGFSSGSGSETEEENSAAVLANGGKISGTSDLLPTDDNAPHVPSDACNKVWDNIEASVSSLSSMSSMDSTTGESANDRRVTSSSSSSSNSIGSSEPAFENNMQHNSNDRQPLEGTGITSSSSDDDSAFDTVNGLGGLGRDLIASVSGLGSSGSTKDGEVGLAELTSGLVDSSMESITNLLDDLSETAEMLAGMAGGNNSNEPEQLDLRRARQQASDEEQSAALSAEASPPGWTGSPSPPPANVVDIFPDNTAFAALEGVLQEVKQEQGITNDNSSGAGSSSGGHLLDPNFDADVASDREVLERLQRLSAAASLATGGVAAVAGGHSSDSSNSNSSNGEDLSLDAVMMATAADAAAASAAAAAAKHLKRSLTALQQPSLSPSQFAAAAHRGSSLQKEAVQAARAVARSYDPKTGRVGYQADLASPGPATPSASPSMPPFSRAASYASQPIYGSRAFPVSSSTSTSANTSPSSSPAPSAAAGNGLPSSASSSGGRSSNLGPSFPSAAVQAAAAVALATDDGSIAVKNQGIQKRKRKGIIGSMVESLRRGPASGVGNGTQIVGATASTASMSSSSFDAALQSTLSFMVPLEYLVADDRPERLLVCGWGERTFMQELIRELDHGYHALPAGSEVVFVNPHPGGQTLTKAVKDLTLTNITISHIRADPLQRSELYQCDLPQFKCAVVLCDETWIKCKDGAAHADLLESQSMLRLDSMVMVVQLNIRKILEEAERPTINILTQRVATHGTTRFEDRNRLPLGISINFTAYAANLLTHVAYSPRGLAAYNAYSSHVDWTIVDSSHLATQGENCSFWALMRRAQMMELILIGWYTLPDRLDRPLETVMNPSRQARSQPRVWNDGEGRNMFVVMQRRNDAALTQLGADDAQLAELENATQAKWVQMREREAATEASSLDYGDAAAVVADVKLGMVDADNPQRIELPR